ncbi:hypothetical protein A628_02595 [Salmonella enterica subsp. enterica serovar Cubana str. 76814]|uniref:Uncharacterized protein n=1 Tax=Salmonella enterica subsp. enterica serovar Cubana str. 76814 TaxID=1192560 RepID=V7IPV2_SALET|nr:hypothetical protein A628_02595 [Salmonella enterica subsp. enterica serovar Cubana str. 76814]
MDESVLVNYSPSDEVVISHKITKKTRITLFTHVQVKHNQRRYIMFY